MYLIFSKRNGGGWLSGGGQLTSDWKDASIITTHANAIEIARRFNGDGETNAFPVSRADVEAVAND